MGTFRWPQAYRRDQAELIRTKIMQMNTQGKIVSCPYEPNHVDIPLSANFGSTLFASLQRYSQVGVIGDLQTGQLVTFEVLKSNAELIARNLISRYECREGDVIAIFGSNSIEWVLFALAAFRIGAVLSAFNSQLKVDELKTHLQLSEAKFLFTDRCLESVAVEAVKDLQIKAIFVKGSCITGSVDFESLLVPHNETQTQLLPALSDLDSRRSGDVVALVMFSSGTTGNQKAVMLSHKNLQASLGCGRQERGKVLDDRNVSFVPFYTIYGLTTIMFTLACGHRTYFMSKFDLTTYLTNVAQLKISFLLLVPPVANLIAKSPSLDEYDLSAVTTVSCGGAPMTRAIEEILFRRLPNLRFISQTYGMTEAAGAFCNTDYNIAAKTRRYGSVGVPMHNVQMKVVDIESGETLDPLNDGEICIKSPSVMLGYRGNEKANAEAIDFDGWLHTGDIGHYDNEGWFYIVDRLKELIKYNAYQVAPAELESVLLSHNAVADAAVVGLPDSKSGELPMAWVVTKPASTVTALQLQEYVNDKVAPYKQLRGGVHFTSVIPKTPSGKILRRELKKFLLEGKL